MCGETRIPRDMCAGNTLPGETYITVTAVPGGLWGLENLPSGYIFYRRLLISEQ